MKVLNIIKDLLCVRRFYQIQVLYTIRAKKGGNQDLSCIQFMNLNWDVENGQEAYEVCERLFSPLNNRTQEDFKDYAYTVTADSIQVVKISRLTRLLTRKPYKTTGDMIEAMYKFYVGQDVFVRLAVVRDSEGEYLKKVTID